MIEKTKTSRENHKECLVGWRMGVGVAYLWLYTFKLCKQEAEQWEQELVYCWLDFIWHQSNISSKYTQHKTHITEEDFPSFLFNYLLNLVFLHLLLFHEQASLWDNWGFWILDWVKEKNQSVNYMRVECKSIYTSRWRLLDVGLWVTVLLHLFHVALLHLHPIVII